MERNIYRCALIPGDGIGPDIMNEAQKVLDAAGKKYGFIMEYNNVLMGGRAIDETGFAFPKDEQQKCLDEGVVLLAAVGGPKWDKCSERPEKGLLTLRKIMETYANLRVTKLMDGLADASPLKREILAGGIDIVIVRELTGGIYFGEHILGEKEAYDVELYRDWEIERIFRTACETAMKRKKKLCLADKANVLSSSKLWRKVCEKILKEYPEIDYSCMYIDNIAMQIIKNPGQFDVIVTSNMFGDILSDEASMLTGSLGMIPSASLGEGKKGIYEPIHGSAPDIAGMNIANPSGMILSAAMMLRYSFGNEGAASAMEKAVETVINKGFRTRDILTAGCTEVTTEKFGTLVAENI